MSNQYALLDDPRTFADVAAKMGKLDIGPHVVATLGHGDDVVDGQRVQVGNLQCHVDFAVAELAAVPVTLSYLGEGVWLDRAAALEDTAAAAFLGVLLGL